VGWDARSLPPSWAPDKKPPRWGICALGGFSLPRAPLFLVERLDQCPPRREITAAAFGARADAA
jgi:hypothetical protein